MAYYGRREDVGARTMRFDYMDRMDEEECDDDAVRRQRVEAYKRSQPRIEPDEVFTARDGSEVGIYLSKKSQQIRERMTEAGRIWRGER